MSALEYAAAISREREIPLPTYGDRPSWRTKPRMFAWVRDEPEALVVWVPSLDEKDALLAAGPMVFFTTPHYDGDPIVLVDLAEIELAEAGELLTESWRLRAPRRLVAAWEAEHPVGSAAD